MKTRLLILSTILISCSTSMREDNNDKKEIISESKSTEEKVTESYDKPTDLVKTDHCLNLLNNVNRAKIKELTGKFTTSTILSSEERKDYSISSDTGTVGLYNLFYVNNNDIIMLGELVVYTESDPTSWKMFEENEQILSIELMSPGYDIDDIIKIGAKIDIILDKYRAIKKFSTDLYTFEDDCESLVIKTRNEIVLSIKVSMK